MKVLGVEQTETYNQIHELIEDFRTAAKNICQTERVRGIIAVEIIPSVELSFHLSGNVVYLKAGKTTYLEEVHNLGELKGERDHLPIRIMSLYHKIEELIIRNKITLLHIEKAVLEIT
ncbi:MAG: hypothetical protein R3250_03730 [Melioribacteraceae bacterium]|nr:hypothetical protein [Melioribacteraceae bacterium]